jgi:hypothetical protein
MGCLTIKEVDMKFFVFYALFAIFLFRLIVMSDSTWNVFDATVYTIIMFVSFVMAISSTQKPKGGGHNDKQI